MCCSSLTWTGGDMSQVRITDEEGTNTSRWGRRSGCAGRSVRALRWRTNADCHDGNVTYKVLYHRLCLLHLAGSGHRSVVGTTTAGGCLRIQSDTSSGPWLLSVIPRLTLQIFACCAIYQEYHRETRKRREAATPILLNSKGFKLKLMRSSVHRLTCGQMSRKHLPMMFRSFDCLGR